MVTFGCNTCGELGVGCRTHEKVPVELPLSRSTKVRLVAVGSDFRHPTAVGVGNLANDIGGGGGAGFHPGVDHHNNMNNEACGHSLVVTEPHGDLYSFGCGAHGRLGLGDEYDRVQPTQGTLISDD